MLGKHFKRIWGWLRELCCPPRLLGGSIKKARKHQITAIKMSGSEGLHRVGMLTTNKSLQFLRRAGGSMEFTSVPTVTAYCRGRHKKNACKNQGQAELTTGHCCLFPSTLYFPLGSKHQILTDSTHVKEGTKLLCFSALSQQMNQNLKHYSVFLRSGLGLDSAAARTVEHCAHLAVPWGHR